jgi:hypothetical protein
MELLWALTASDIQVKHFPVKLTVEWCTDTVQTHTRNTQVLDSIFYLYNILWLCSLAVFCSMTYL